MSTIRSSEPAESDNGSDTNSSQSKPSSSSPLKFGLMTRSRMMGTRGLAASSIGWVLVGCIAFGFGVGALLDRQLGTAYWMPVMVMVGIAAGFREMFRTLAELNKQPPTPRKERAQSTSVATATPSGSASRTGNAAQSTLVEEKPRQRIFDVPAPPTASFDARPATQKERKTEAVEDDPEALIRRLLNETQNDEPNKDKSA